MRALLATLVAAGLLAGCQMPPASGTLKYGTGDGQTMPTAVQVRTRSESEGGTLIMNWVRSHYPAWTIQAEKNFEEGERAYHMVTLKGPENAVHTVYFDISTYYRRMGSSKFPKPLT